MRIFSALITLFLISTTWAVTPDIGTATYTPSYIECPDGRVCKGLDEYFCSKDNIEIFPIDNNSFDLLFNDFDVETDSQHDYGHASCLLEIPIKIPQGKRINLKEVSISGYTIIPSGGRSNASITYFSNGRESTRLERFAASESFAVTHSQELNTGYSSCGRGNAVVGTRISIAASKPFTEPENTLMSVSSGSGRLVYRLNYEDCDPGPDECGEMQL